MKKLWIVCVAVTNVAFAQSKSDTTQPYDYGERIYNSSPCGGCPPGGYKPAPVMKNVSPYNFVSNNPIVLDMDSIPQGLWKNDSLMFFKEEKKALIP